jgi:Fe-S-cluster containining protein
MASNSPLTSPWYRDGLRFECTGCCGRCCGGSFGYVWVDEAEIRALAGHLGLDVDAFGRRYLRRVGARYALLEGRDSGDCVFLDALRCAVYPARPRQCQSYPFWSALVESEKSWARAASECEGIRAEAALVAASTITELRRG